MNWAWVSSLDHVWRSPSFPVWLTLAAAGFFSLIVLITLLRAEKSVANGALTVITLLAVGIAVAATLRGFGPVGNASRSSEPPTAMASLPALSCVDDLAGETVLTACEKTLFGSAESIAAAIAYAGSMITRLVAVGDVATANRNLTPELEALRRAVERDRYGLMAYVLAARDHCTAAACPAFRSLANTKQIASNMDDRAYEGLVVRYSGSWNAPAVAPAMALPGIPPGGAMAALPPGIPAGKPTTADFPSSASTPPVSIMMPEPGAPGSAAPPRQAATPAATAPLPASRPAATQAAAPPPAAKKQPAPKAARAPTPITPSSPPPAPAAAADND
jgi:hypothetical protein